jgi:hypothetical protein
LIDDVDLAGAAALMHRSIGRFTREWRALVVDEGFPLPFAGGGKRQRPWWRVADIEAWKQRKSLGLPHPKAPATRGNLAQRPAPIGGPPAANDRVAPPLRSGDLAAQLLAAAGE